MQISQSKAYPAEDYHNRKVHDHVHDPLSHSDHGQNPMSDKNKMNPKPLTLSKELFNLDHHYMIPLLFMLSFFVYFDRGGLSASLKSAQQQVLDDSASESGAVASCYLFGWCLSAPIFALLGGKYPPLKMSSIGMTVWCIGVFTTGLPNPEMISPLLWLAGSRLLTGIGEASYLAFVGTIIDIIAPNSSRALWLGTFYMSIPLGVAMGYAVGGTIAEMDIWIMDSCDTPGDDGRCNESWRVIFLSEVLFVVPLCLVIYCIKQPVNMLVIKMAKEELEQKRANGRGGSGLHNRLSSVSCISHSDGLSASLLPRHKGSDDMKDDKPCIKITRLLHNRTFVLTCLGYAFQTFVTGTFAVEGIAYLQNVYGWTSGTAGFVFGVLTFMAGVSGSVFGGMVLDKMKASYPEGSPAFKYCGSALRLLIILDLIAFPSALIVVLWDHTSDSSVPIFVVGTFIAEFCIFASAGPVNNAVLWSVQYRDRPLAIAMSTLCVHTLGDAMAPILIGRMVDYSTENGHDAAHAYAFAFAVATCWLLLSAMTFTASACTIGWLNRWMTEPSCAGTPSLLINDTGY